MRICSFSIVKNESDIIEAFCRHNVKYVDRMYILDNMSSDATPAIIKELIKEGLPIRLMHDKSASFNQGGKTTRFYRKIERRRKFDVVFLIDSDEFIHYPTRDVLVGRPGDVFSIKRFRHVMPEVAEVLGVTSDKSGELPVRRMRLRMIKPENSKRVLFCGEPKTRRLRIGTGNHNVSIDYVRLSRTFLPGVCLHHYPIRSREQFIQKNVGGVIAQDLYSYKRKSVGTHWRRHYEFMMSKRFEFTDSEMISHIYKTANPASLAKKVVEDDLGFDFDLKYAHLIEGPSPLYAMLRSYERTVVSYWELKNEIAALKAGCLQNSGRQIDSAGSTQNDAERLVADEIAPMESVAEQGTYAAART